MNDPGENTPSRQKSPFSEFRPGRVMRMHHAKKYARAAVLLAVALHSGNFLAQAQTLTAIHSFTGTNGDGDSPFPPAPLVFDNNGAVYGTAAGGGTGNDGTVFQFLPP